MCVHRTVHAEAQQDDDVLHDGCAQHERGGQRLALKQRPPGAACGGRLEGAGCRVEQSELQARVWVLGAALQLRAARARLRARGDSHGGITTYLPVTSLYSLLNYYERQIESSRRFSWWRISR